MSSHRPIRSPVLPSRSLLRRVWRNGHAIAGYDAACWRWDRNGRAIRFEDFGDRGSPWGWTISEHAAAGAVPQRYGVAA